MTLPALSLQSESYSATGNLAAEGFRKLLGTPSLDLLQTVIREATQNCCDAAKLGVGPEIHFRLRRLTESQIVTMRQHILRDLPQPESSEAPLRYFLEKEEHWVLEICDFNTVGLAGPTRADRIPSGNDATDFIDFLRNVGSRRDTVQGGGTYGYGKAALYLSSRCSTILVDTQTRFLGQDVRRLIGCHLGSAHDLTAPDGTAERRTGRHWWGELSDDGTIADPVEGTDAERLAGAAGFLSRTPARRGTSIMIVDPWFVGDGGQAPEVVMGLITEALLWHFWPRMLSDTAPLRKINIGLELDGELFPLPAPEDFPPLDNFAAAMREIRNGTAGAADVMCRLPRKRLGRLAIRKGLRATRQRLVPTEISLIPETASHIAVMRTVELVVRYFEYEPLPDPRVEWAGVFVSDSDPEVEAAFAAAEPPAHDDWQPKMLPKGHSRTFVNVALTRIREAATEVAVPSSGAHGQGEGGPSLARVSGQFGKLLDSFSGGGAGPALPIGGGSSSRKKNRISQPAFLRLEEAGSRRVAVFETTVHHDGRNPGLEAVAKPMLVLDGGAAGDGAWATTAPEILSWSKPDGTVLSTRESVPINGYSGDLEIRVAMPDDCAVTVRSSLEDRMGEET